MKADRDELHFCMNKAWDMISRIGFPNGHYLLHFFIAQRSEGTHSCVFGDDVPLSEGRIHFMGGHPDGVMHVQA